MSGHGGYAMTLKIVRNMQNDQRGVTLIELLISITIGLVILIAIGAAYVNSTNLARQRENQSELNDPARNVMQQLQKDISSAGFVDLFDDDSTLNRPLASSLYVAGDEGLANLYQRVPTGAPLSTPLGQFFPGLLPVFGCDGAMNSTPNAIALSPTPAPAPAVSCGVGNAVQHSLQIAYQALPSAGAKPMSSLLPANAATGNGLDCLQQGLVGPATGREAIYVINRYFVQPSTTDSINELLCSGAGSATPQPIARGIEEFVLRYQTGLPGTATSGAAGGVQSQYLSAADVSASALGWANVTAVEVCMVAATATTSGAAAAGTTALQTNIPTCLRDAAGNFSPNPARPLGDTRLWKRFTFVKTVRNAIYSTPY